MKFQINSLRELKEKQKLFVIETCLLGDPVLESPILKEIWLDPRVKIKGNLGMTKEQIWEKWWMGADGPGKTPDNDLDVDIIGYWSYSRTIGSVSLNGIVQRLNRKFLQGWLTREQYRDLFEHICHEGFHKISFYHSGKWSRNEDVTYQFGRCSEKAFVEYYKVNKYDKEELRGRAQQILKGLNPKFGRATLLGADKGLGGRISHFNFK